MREAFEWEVFGDVLGTFWEDARDMFGAIVGMLLLGHYVALYRSLCIALYSPFKGPYIALYGHFY